MIIIDGVKYYSEDELRELLGLGTGTSNYRDTRPIYVFPTRQDAEKILALLVETASTYGYVTVADYYERIMVPIRYKDRQYGWSRYDLDKATVASRIKYGSRESEYYIDLPKPTPEKEILK